MIPHPGSGTLLNNKTAFGDHTRRRLNHTEYTAYIIKQFIDPFERFPVFCFPIDIIKPYIIGKDLIKIYDCTLLPLTEGYPLSLITVCALSFIISMTSSRVLSPTR